MKVRFYRQLEVEHEKFLKGCLTTYRGSYFWAERVED